MNYSDSFRSRARHFFPFLAVHIAVVVMFGLDFNHFHQGTFFSSGGSESFCVSIALTAPLVLLATWVTNRQSYPDKIIIMVSFSCSLLMLMFCGLQDRITSYKMTFFDGVYGFMMAGSLAFFTVYGKEYLTKASCTELLYLLNVTSVVSLPFFALLFGEFWPLKDEIKKRGAYNVVHRVLVLAVLRLASQTACLFHLSHSTPLLNATTRGFAWIWTTIWISLFIHVHNGELLLPIFLSFWIYGLFNYIPILFSDLRWI